MSEPGILSLHPSHIGFTDDVVFLCNELGIDLVPITDMEKALPQANQCP